jgi:transcriptional regulator with XRE-family HTH domain
MTRRDDFDQLYELWIRGVGMRIRAARRARELSQETLAERANISRGTLAEVERHGRNLTLRSLYAIAAVLGMHAAELLDDRDRPAAE